jgi:hypothetical protein
MKNWQIVTAVIFIVLLISFFSTYGKILKKHSIRSDSQGDGNYMASRGSRDHKGIDLLCEPGEKVTSPYFGTITREFNAYANDNDYKGLELETAKARYKIMYLKPKPGIVGKKVFPGQKIGVCDDISKKYSGAMSPHLHVEKWVDGVNVNPKNDFL